MSKRTQGIRCAFGRHNWGRVGLQPRSFTSYQVRGCTNCPKIQRREGEWSNWDSYEPFYGDAPIQWAP